MDNLTIRPFAPADQEAARRVVLEGLGEHFGFVDQSLNPDLDDIQTSFIAAGNNFYVAVRHGDIVGTAGVLFEERRARIVRMSVLRNHRKAGIARALLARCIEAARFCGFSEIVAFTEPHWPDAVGFYTSSGFWTLDWWLSHGRKAASLG